VLAVRLATSNWMAWQMSVEIRDGTLSAKLLRPIHPLYSYAADHLSAIPMRILVVSPIVAGLIVTSWGRLVRHDPRLLLVLGASLVGAWLLVFFSMVLLGSLAFFVDSAMGPFELWIGVHALFSGYLIPLEVLRGWVGSAVIDVLPFRFMLAFPVEVLVGLMSPADAIRQLAVQWLYVALTGVLALRAWRAGVRRYAAFGG
jgi:ABC-2 type transport system permease protein